MITGLTKHNRKEIDKLLKHNSEWLHNNEVQKTNKILAILTFFIALGEISNISKNIFENNINIFYTLTTIIALCILIIFTFHKIKKKKHTRHTTKECQNIIKENYKK